MDTLNRQAAGVVGNEIAILLPKTRLTPDEAMMFAAYLVVMAQMCDPTDKLPAIGDCIEAVENT